MLYHAILWCKSMPIVFFCFVFFPTSVILCIGNSSPRSRASIQISTATFWGVWEVRSAKAIGSVTREELVYCTTTMHRHQALFTREFLAKINIASLPLSSLFARFSTIGLLFLPKMQLKRCRYPERIAEGHRHVLTENDFQARFKKWQERWDRCIAAKGDYIEGVDVKGKYISFVFKHNWFGSFWIPSRIIE